MGHLKHSALAIMAVAVGSCVGLQSAQFDEGVVYHLPRSLLTITVTQYNDKAAGRTWYQIGGYTPPTGDRTPGTLNAEIKDESIPDPGHRYVAKYRPNPLSDDRLCVTRSQTGLLRDVQFAADDRTSEVVFNIARVISAAFGGERKTGLTTSSSTEKPVIRSYTGKLDPLNEDDVVVFNRAMTNVFGERVEIDFHRMKDIFKENTAQLPPNCWFGRFCEPEVWSERCGRDNICYRTKIDVPIDLKHNGRRVDVSYAKVINPWDIGAISVTRAFLVHKVSKFKFEKGVLVSAVIRKPSEIEELSLLPMQVIYGALAVPSGALSTAFGGNDAGKTKIAEKLGVLSEKANNNATLIAQTQQGLGPDLGPKQRQIYNLDCGAPGGGTGLINIVTGGSLDSK